MFLEVDVENGGVHSTHFPQPPRSNTHLHAMHSRSSNNGSRGRSVMSFLRTGNGAMVFMGIVIVGLLVTVVTFQRQFQRTNDHNRALRRDLDAMQSTLEMIAGEQLTNSADIKKLSLRITAEGETLATSFDAKVSTAKSQLNQFQSTLGGINTKIEEQHAAMDRIRNLESQMEMVRRMFGVGPDYGHPNTPPDPRGNNNDHGDQQQQPQQQQPQQQAFLPGGLPSQGNPTPYHQQQAAAPDSNVYHPLIDRAPDLPDDTKTLPDDQRNVARAERIKQEIRDSWGAYRQYAWGHDELCPNTLRHKDWGGSRGKGLGLTAADSLSTLWLAGLHDEFDEGVKLVTQFIDYDQDISVSVFETTIRIVGGILSAYELNDESNEELLATAVYVMNKLLHAFNTSTAIPHQTVNLRNHHHWNPEWSNGASILSEFGSLQLELRTLSYHTKDPVYDMKATHLLKILEGKCKDMVCPTLFDVGTADVRSDHVTLGALGDSFYEYLVKQYLLTDRTESKYKELAVSALDALRVRLFRYSTPGHQGYFGETVDGGFDYKMDHLACFAGGMYALASTTVASDDASRAATYLKIATDLTETCYQMYDQQATGIAPEIVEFSGGQDFHAGEAYYLLRPETVESIFYMWRATKDEKYRSYQWKIFQHLKEHCKSTVSKGYCGLTMVSLVPAEQDDLMQSFWLAETLKYLYLTFVDDDVLDLDKWVFNTEAHPFKIRRRDPMDIWRQWEDAHGGTLPWLPPSVDGVEVVETEMMVRLRLADGGGVVRRVAPVDPHGSDTQADFDETSDPDARVPYDVNEDVFRRTRPTRHDVVMRKVKQVSRALPNP